MKALDIIKGVAPILGTVLGGPLGPLLGLGVSVIADKLGVQEKTKEAVLETVERMGPNLPPEVVAKLQEANIEMLRLSQEHLAVMARIDADMDRIAADDRANAREREIKTGDSWTPRILVFCVMVAFFACVAYVVRYPLPEGQNEIAWFLIGGLMTAFTQGFSYYLGSSSGSANRAKTIDNIAVRNR